MDRFDDPSLGKLVAVELRRYAEVGHFLAEAGDFLAAREAEHNLILGICSNLAEVPDAFATAPYLAAVLDGGRVVAAAVQTPPHNLVLSEIDDPAAVLTLVEDRWDHDLPGALGPVEHARAFVERYTGRPGWAYRLHMSERIYKLTTLRPPPAVAGRMRVAVAGDRELVVAWINAFMLEALGEADPIDTDAIVGRSLAGMGRTIYLWEDGEPVSLCGVGGTTPNGVRIGPVYTPPEARRRGYASALVARASQFQLDAGRRFCFLFTNLENPTSNHIYGAIGYEAVRDVDAYRVDRP